MLFSAYPKLSSEDFKIVERASEQYNSDRAKTHGSQDSSSSEVVRSSSSWSHPDFGGRRRRTTRIRGLMPGIGAVNGGGGEIKPE